MVKITLVRRWKNIETLYISLKLTKNELLSLIFLKTNELEKVKIKKAGKNTRLSSYAPPPGPISNHLLKDIHELHLLYQDIQASIKSPSLN